MKFHIPTFRAVKLDEARELLTKKFESGKADLRRQSLRLLARVDRNWPSVKKALPKQLKPYANELEKRVLALLEKIPSSIDISAEAMAPRTKSARKAQKAMHEAEEISNPITHTASDDHPVLEIMRVARPLGIV